MPVVSVDKKPREFFLSGKGIPYCLCIQENTSAELAVGDCPEVLDIVNTAPKGRAVLTQEIIQVLFLCLSAG